MVLLIFVGSIEAVLHANYNKRTSDFEDWHTLDGINADVLFVGNSRTWVHYDPQHWGTTFNKKFYCLAQDGYTINILYAKLEKYLEDNKKPDVIFLQVDPLFVDNRPGFYSKESFLKYIFLDKEGINHALRYMQGYVVADEYIPLLRYKGNLDKLVEHLKGIEKYTRTDGFLAKDQEWDVPDEDSLYKWNYKSEYLNEITRFKDLCDREGIKLVTHYPPVFYKLYPRTGNEDTLLSLLRSHNIPYIDWNQMDTWDIQPMFFNNTHLNVNGVAHLNEIVTEKKDSLSVYLN